MMKKLTFLIWAGILLLVSSCAQFPFLDRFQAQTTPTPDRTPTLPTSPTATASPEPAGPETKSLTIWVPPQWDPNAENDSGELFRQRVDEFSNQLPSVRVTLRVKALNGPGGILETLKAAQDAAPLVIPDVVALPRSSMEQAVSDGTITALDENENFSPPESWYPYASQLATVNERIYGMPFAADVLVLAYKSDSIEEPPGDWESLLTTQKPMAFPASDTNALVTMAFYESLGGNIAVLNDHYVLDRSPLRRLFSFYQRANEADVMPYWLTQFDSDQQAWNAYRDRQSTQVITWSSNYLTSDSPNTALGALPTSNGMPFSYATGWMWSVTTTDPEQADLALQFIDFVSEEEFIADWNSAAGFVPVHSTALSPWLAQNENLSVFEQLLPASKSIPSQDELDQIGPVFNQAVLSVLKEQMEPEEAVSQVLDQFDGQ